MENKNKLTSALIKAQAEFDAVTYDKINPHFKSRFASLTAIRKATQPALFKHGLSVIQPWSHTESGDIIIYTKLIHESGEILDSSCILPRGNKTDQQLGSSITYLRRYQLSSVLGVSAEEDEDDDAERAVGRGYQARPEQRLAAPPKIESRAKEWPSDAFQQTKPNIELVRASLRSEGIPGDRLDEWIRNVQQTNNMTLEKVLDHCLNSSDKFKTAFLNWLGSVSKEAQPV